MKLSIAAKIQGTIRALGVNVHRWPTDRHLALEYPVSTRPRYGFKRPPHPQIAQLLEAKRGEFERILADIGRRKPLLSGIPAGQPDEPLAPFWNNGWFPALDAAALMHFLMANRPRRYLEIGSGNSTIFARHAISQGGLPTSLTSIDPEPRRGIDQLCDEIVRSPLEDVDLGVFERLAAGDILFFDGSHRVFNDSDVTVFFLEVLPRVAPGVLVHIHDIFWPQDYPPEWGERYYSEQYMLAMLLLYAPAKIDTVLANAFISLDPDLGRRAAELTDGEPLHERFYGMSYWFRMA
ncbi:MAG TPA: class I SAM-dependent methyltransferase [Allosphingosinicella sp.]